MGKIAIIGAASRLGREIRQQAQDICMTDLVLYDARPMTGPASELEQVALYQGQLTALQPLVKCLRQCVGVVLLDIQDPRATLRIIEAMTLLDKQQLVTITPDIQYVQIAMSQSLHHVPMNQAWKRNIEMSVQLLKASDLLVERIDPPSYDEQVDNDRLISLIGQRFIAEIMGLLKASSE